MCGIAGLWSIIEPTGKEELAVKAMTDSMVHRGPDSSGIWSSSDKSLVLGHRRLAIQDISPLGHQPMMSHSDQFAIVFNGEIYNFKELQKQLESNNIKFQGHSDTEIMLAAFEIWGIEKTIESLEGMYAIALYDKNQQELWLIRDRMGEKPLYYYLDDNILLFASELKSLQQAFPQPLALDKEQLMPYFRYGYFSPTDTPFKEVKKLSPGHNLHITKQQLKQTSNTENLSANAIPYWDLTNNVDVNTRNSEFNSQIAKTKTDEFEKLLFDTVKKQSIADVDLGVFLSGGIDSSLITSALNEVSETKIKTYTIAFDDKRYNEADFARRIAEHLDTDHTEIKLSMDECFETIKLLPKLLDEPFADASLLPTYLVTHAARKHVTVCLSGDGGDELFAGYNRYISGNNFSNKSQNLPGFIRSGLSQLLQFFSVKTLDTAYKPVMYLQQFLGKTPEKDIGIKLHKIARLLAQPDAHSIYVDLMSFWRDNPMLVDRTLSKGYYESLTEFQINDDFINNAMLHDQKFYLCSDNLFKVDRAAMLNSLEVRVPLLNHSIVEFANALPLAYKVRQGKSKWIMRELLYRYVPQNLIDRPKMGFSVPLSRWLRNELKSWAYNYISNIDLLESALLDKKKISKVWDEHQNMVQDHALAIWTITSYLIWFETNQNKILN